MNNTVLVESKLRQKLKLTCSLMCVFCLCFIAVLVCVFMIGRQNLNGQTTTVTGTLSEAYVGDTNTVTIDGNGHYNVIWKDKDYQINLADYVGKTVTLIVTNDTFASNPWALGLVVEEQTVVDYHATLSEQTAYNNELKTIFIVVTAVLCVATCGLFIWRFNVQPLTERELYKEFAEFLAQRQPVCKQRKSIIVYVCVYIALTFALLIAAIALDPDSETISEASLATKALLLTLLAVVIAGLAGLFALREWVVRREIDFYARSLPFDFNDISHAPMRKKVKEELQKIITKEREEHPHTYADGGNGYDVTFGENGVTLSIPMDDEGASIEMPAAEEVFAYNDSEAQPNDLIAADNVFGTRNGLQKNVMTITYDTLNLEAIAYFRKVNRPMMIIIKSRLERTDDFPEEFVNDIHIPFDLNLFNTLKLYNVAVENLDYLLQNSRRLMMENCLTFSKNKSKIAK